MDAEDSDMCAATRRTGSGHDRGAVARFGRSSLDTEFSLILGGRPERRPLGLHPQRRDPLAPAAARCLRAQGADDLDGLTSEVLACVISGCRSFTGNEAQFRSWVFTTAHRRPVDAGRVKTWAPEVGVLDAESLSTDRPTTAGAKDEAMDRLAVEEVHQLLDSPSSDQRDVLALRIPGQMSVEQGPVALDMPPGAMKALQGRALGTLSRRLVPEAVPQ